MQNVIDPTPTPSPAIHAAKPARTFSVTVEGIAYVVIVLFALLLRLAELDTVPLASSELAPALAALRAAVVESSGAALISSSPLNFLLQGGLFTLFGASEFTARLPVALAGGLVVLMPLAFRPTLGAGRALALSVILAFSPVLLIASKFSEPMVYAALLTGLGLWAVTRFYSQTDHARTNFGTLAIICLIGLILLTEVGGSILALILLLAGALTWLWERVDHEAFEMGSRYDSTPSTHLRGIRWGTGVGIGLFVALLIATGFMLHPAGLGGVAAVIGGALRGWVEAAPHSTAAYPLAVALFYEPFVLALAIAGVVARRSRIPTFDRFLIAWAVVGAIISVIYAGGAAAHALWITLPLSALASRALIEALRPEDSKLFLPPPAWARWVVGVACASVLAILTLALQALARSMITSLDGMLLSVPLQPDSLVILLVALMFLFIGYFLFASLWGNLTSAQGFVLGVAIFGLITSLGAGWNAAVFRADSPTVLYHMRAMHADTQLLRATLDELTLRNSRGFRATLDVVALAPQDDMIAWLLRDYPRTRFINNVNDARGAPIILAPASLINPDFGGAYLGQTFTIARTWDNRNLRGVDALAWWTQNRLPNREGIAQEQYVLWLRQDVWDGSAPVAVG